MGGVTIEGGSNNHSIPTGYSAEASPSPSPTPAAPTPTLKKLNRLAFFSTEVKFDGVKINRLQMDLVRPQGIELDESTGALRAVDAETYRTYRRNLVCSLYWERQTDTEQYAVIAALSGAKELCGRPPVTSAQRQRLISIWSRVRSSLGMPLTAPQWRPQLLTAPEIWALVDHNMSVTPSTDYETQEPRRLAQYSLRELLPCVMVVGTDALSSFMRREQQRLSTPAFGHKY